MNGMVMFPCRRCCYKVFKDAMFGRIFTNICTCLLKLERTPQFSSSASKRAKRTYITLKSIALL